MSLQEIKLLMLNFLHESERCSAPKEDTNAIKMGDAEETANMNLHCLLILESVRAQEKETIRHFTAITCHLPFLEGATLLSFVTR